MRIHPALIFSFNCEDAALVSNLFAISATFTFYSQFKAKQEFIQNKILVLKLSFIFLLSYLV